MHVLGSIRRAHQVKLPAVRQAIDYLRRRFRSDHPLLERQMLTDGKDLFIEQYEHLVNISQDGQMEMRQIMAVYLKRLEWDRGGIPIRCSRSPATATRNRPKSSPSTRRFDSANRASVDANPHGDHRGASPGGRLDCLDSGGLWPETRGDRGSHPVRRPNCFLRRARSL